MTDATPPDAERVGAGAAPLIGRRGAASVGAASIVSALTGYGVLVVAARHLTAADNAQFLVYWSMVFALFGVLGGLQQEATRTVGSTLVRRPADGAPRARVLPWALAVGALLAVLVAVTSPLWRRLSDVGVPTVVLGVTVLAVVAYAGHVALVGVLAGQRGWETSSLLIGAEATVRLVLVLVVASTGGAVGGLSVATAAAAGTWVLLLLVPEVRRAGAARGDVPRRALVSGLLQASVAATGFAVLVVGFPTLLRVTTDAATWRSAAPLVLAISMTRAPLMMPLAAFQGVAIGYFMDPRRPAGAAMVRLGAAVAAVGLVGAAAAGLVGPALMEVFFGAAYRLDGALLAGLTFASAVLAMLVLSGSAVLALGRHTVYALGWWVATLAAVLCLLAPVPLETRALIALLVGPAAGVAVLVPVLRSARGGADVPGA